MVNIFKSFEKKEEKISVDKIATYGYKNNSVNYFSFGKEINKTHHCQTNEIKDSIW